MKTERLEKFIARDFGFVLVAFENALHENIAVHNPDHAPLRVNHRKCEKLIEHEKFTRFEHGRLGGQCDHARDHDFAQLCSRRSGQQSARGHNTHQPFAFIDRVKINDAFANPFTADRFQRFLDARISLEQREIFARVIKGRRVEIDRAGNSHRCTLCTIPLFRKISAASPK